MTAFFLGKWIPSSKRLFLALCFLDCVKARLDPSPFLCPQRVWLWLGVATGIKRAQDDSVFFGKKGYQAASDSSLRLAFWAT
jgi:hypothetical protein